MYPQAAPCDAPYSVSESDLRSSIYIPEGFTYGKKPPVVLFPGSGSTGYLTFAGNFIPLLQDVDWADPVWVNVPGLLLDDVRRLRVGATNSEPQSVCKRKIGGSLFTHESMLTSSLTFALAKDALTHDGTGQVSRLDLDEVCSSLVAPGLELGDFLLT